MSRRRDEDDDDEDRPRKRRRERDDQGDEEERPRRARKKGKSRLGLWIGLGVGGVALAGIVTLMIVLLSSGGGAGDAKFVGKWEKIDPKGAGAPFVEFTNDGVFVIGRQEFMVRFGPYTVTGKSATATTSKTTNFSIQDKKVETIRATLTSDDELSVTYPPIAEKYRRMKQP